MLWSLVPVQGKKLSLEQTITRRSQWREAASRWLLRRAQGAMAPPPAGLCSCIKGGCACCDCVGPHVASATALHARMQGRAL